MAYYCHYFCFYGFASMYLPTYNLPSIFHDLHLKDLAFLILNSSDYFTLKPIKARDKINAIE